MSYGLMLKCAVYGLALWLIYFFASLFLIKSLGAFEYSILGEGIILIAFVFIVWPFSADLKLVSLSQGFLVGLGWLFLNLTLDYFVIVVSLNKGDLGYFGSHLIIGKYLLLLSLPLLLSSRRKPS